eukprot:UN13412
MESIRSQLSNAVSTIPCKTSRSKAISNFVSKFLLLSCFAGIHHICRYLYRSLPVTDPPP